MKRLICLILIISLCLCLPACRTQQTETFQDPVAFYFLRAQTDTVDHGTPFSVIVPVTREGQGMRSNLSALLNRYFSDPATETTRSPFPAGTYVISVSNDTDTLEITLTDAFATLTGLDLTLACACLTRTVLDLTGTGAVRICAETKLLDGHPSITMDRSNLLLIDIATQPTENER